MDNSGELLYIKFDTCPPLYWYLGVYRRLRLACPPHADQAAVSFRFDYGAEKRSTSATLWVRCQRGGKDIISL